MRRQRLRRRLSGRRGVVKQFITITTVTLLLRLQTFAAVTNEVVTSLTYVGRSTESSSTVAVGSSLGSEVSAALALPLNPNQVIFDGGAYWMPDVTPTGVLWASWPMYGSGNPEVPNRFEARHFQATFTLPLGLHNVVGFTLFSAYYTAAGDLIPINDNAYFYLNGTYIGAKGTSYGASNAPLPVPGLDIHETDGCHQDGSFGLAPVSLLQSGANVLDIVGEDWLFGGGTGPLTVKLLDEVPEPSTTVLVALSLLSMLGVVRARRSS